MVMPRDWIPPFPPGIEGERKNAVHRKAWEEFARQRPGSNYYQRSAHAWAVLNKAEGGT